MKKESNLIFKPASACTISLSPYALGKEYEKKSLFEQYGIYQI
ncbi:hypothetical protein [Bacteroides heparinolyticus]|uniref:Uncharacterized protein n=1 Tax=Prevotella heparinolytica TaxID=28113 RepID=A0A449I1Z7_9BACE|nr:hypothetical protein [Bacteroides heparinolyticus]VFB13470.1 Uncharacterised protein [Bacteroides heparinolyticus]